jgi:lipopolysaccharide transport system ATP-binding protein
MTCSISVRNVTRTFHISESTGAPVTLWSALRNEATTKYVKEIQAVNGVSFELCEGERLGIIGRNGAGKSTLLNIIAGLAPPTSGEVQSVGKTHAIMTIGHVLRHEGTGRENIYLDGAVQGKSTAEIDTVIERIIEFAELGEFIDRPTRTYSSGMKARLAFAMIAFIEPEILIIDEVLSVGDAKFAEKASLRMKELTEAGRIVIFVSHSLGSVIELCTRCIWLDAGKIVMDGDPSRVVDAYKRSVDDLDAAELLRKFSGGFDGPSEAAKGSITCLNVMQGDAGPRVAVKAMQPIELQIGGRGARELVEPDLLVQILRVDGTVMWKDLLSCHQPSQKLRGTFSIKLRFDPFLLGENLFRLDAVLVDGSASIASRSSVFEVQDDEGQVGGRPMIYLSPQLAARPLKMGTEL